MSTSSTPYGGYYSEPRRSGWLGFAGLLSVMIGAFHAMQGFIALFVQNYFLTPGGSLLVLDYTTWGWIWLAIGFIQIAVGLGILAGKTWARWLGAIFASLAMIGQFAFLNAYPIWSVVDITLCVLVIYGLVAAPKHAIG
ncbi:DUF7144 family membrane protein [Thermoactinospora rubra]|uniref:DUF7144 family membrane protein n=1 Tax=Thermoactinospora rubra TaxID=1088767 RepID=UPI000A0F4204|nr:hypothetical protein [Thermoactinospora rubra]